MTRKRSEYRRDEDEPRAPKEYTIAVPNDPVNEQAIIAALIADPELRKRAPKLFPAEAMYSEKNRAIVNAIYEAGRRGLPYDEATLARLGGDDFDLALLQTIREQRPDAPAPETFDFLLDTLLWDWHLAQVARGPVESLLEAIQNPKEERERVRALARQVGLAFEGAVGSARYLRDPKEVVREMMEDVRRRVDGEAHFPFGVDGLDYFEDGEKRLRPGAAPGLITMVTSITGGGKTTTIGHLCLGLARQRRRVLFGAWEVLAPMTLELLATLSLEWSRSRLLDGRTNRAKQPGDTGHEKLSREEVVLLEERAHAISGYVGFMKNPVRHRTERARRATNRDNLEVVADHIVQSGCAVFIADLFQRILVETRPEDEQEALYLAQTHAEELRVHDIFAHQQRHKDVESRADKKPTREGIKGSGAWLDVCSTVIAPHIPAKWKRVPDETIEYYILKQRFGPWPLGVEMDWDPDKGQISGGRSISYDQGGGETSDDATGIGPISRRAPKKRRGI